MRIYLDTEFVERGYERIELISIGLVAEDGREFYAVASDGWDPEHANDWVKANVLTKLGNDPRMPRTLIAEMIRDFAGEKPEFWGYYSDYDWVLLCQLFGTMMDLPKGWPMFCRDVIQLCKDNGDPRLPKQDGSEHNALADARHILVMHEYLAMSRVS